jgi:hypothetical protein
MYEVTFVAGFVDGLWETLEGVVDMAEGVSKRSLHRMIIDPSGFKKQIQDDAQAARAVISIMSDKTQRKAIFDAMKSELGEWFDDASGQNGRDNAGYAQGKIVFDVLISFVGVGEAKALLKTNNKAQAFVKLMKKARRFERKILGQIKKSGKYGKVVEQVTLTLKDGTRARFDGIGKKGGSLYELIEAKMGKGKLSKNQKKVLEALNNGDDIIPVGKKAEQIFGEDAIGKSITKELSKDVNLNGSVQSAAKVIKDRR